MSVDLSHLFTSYLPLFSFSFLALFALLYLSLSFFLASPSVSVFFFSIYIYLHLSFNLLPSGLSLSSSFFCFFFFMFALSLSLSLLSSLILLSKFHFMRMPNGTCSTTVFFVHAPSVPLSPSFFLPVSVSTPFPQISPCISILPLPPPSILRVIEPTIQTLLRETILFLQKTYPIFLTYFYWLKNFGSPLSYGHSAECNM